MSSRYVEPQASRIVHERIEGVEQLRIRMRRNWFVVLFLCFWISIWTTGGASAMHQLVQHPNAFLVFWLGGWALGELFAAATIASQLAGSEIIRVVGRDLEISTGVGPLRWRRLYRGDLIRYLDSSDPNPMGWPGWSQVNGVRNGPFGKVRSGAIKFDYGSETIYAAASVDEAEGRDIVDWLRPKLPRSATDTSI